MSEAGKVSLPGMTPERQEGIKRDAQEESETIYGNCSANITNIELLELLAALEEAQQQLVNIQPTLEAERARGDKWEKAFDNADRQYLKQEKAAADIRRQLAEAQQTIARQSAALGWYELGKPDLARAAMGETQP
ncbi:hypothetical protein [Paenibacillus sp. IHBB 3054]|uniref:hypothetical protein n=1 Tax=Paenibacillus sp. IHBB 3054 TaxID=3425689 RepID=UPI003F671AD5